MMPDHGTADPYHLGVVLRALEKIAPPLVSVALTKLLDVGQKKKIESLQAFALDLGQRLSRIEAKCDPEVLDDLLKRAMVSAMFDSRRERLCVLAKVLEGTYCADVDPLQGRLFFDLASRFDVHHLHVLRILRDVPGTDRGRDGTADAAVGFAYLETELRRSLGRSDPAMTDITTLALSELVSCSLLRTRLNAQSAGKLMGRNLNPIGLLRMQVVCLSALGTQFARFIELRDPAADRRPT